MREGMQYIRAAYGVPAKRGGYVIYTGGAHAQKGVITGADGKYLMVRLPGEKKARKYHPTWQMEYL